MVNTGTPVQWHAASAFIVCSIAISIGVVEKYSGVCLILNILQCVFLEDLKGYHGIMVFYCPPSIVWSIECKEIVIPDKPEMNKSRSAVLCF